MQSDGWVASQVVARDGRPDKKVNDLTDAGRTELSTWIAEPAGLEAARSDLAVKIRGAAYDDAAAVVAEVTRQRARHAHKLEY